MLFPPPPALYPSLSNGDSGFQIVATSHSRNEWTSCKVSNVHLDPTVECSISELSNVNNRFMMETADWCNRKHCIGLYWIALKESDEPSSYACSGGGTSVLSCVKEDWYLYSSAMNFTYQFLLCPCPTFSEWLWRFAKANDSSHLLQKMWFGF